ncbi:hypothetical protein ST47_g920 [Ascochyta rabiei]|uniref:Uncharacterized protein n=1 Tax=Didymella rabiei TaxID=5454 RepID=A0A163LMM7_DIDRA|nr:hypothetical protein ST47_g920 [Ascochyta rabiei]
MPPHVPLKRQDAAVSFDPYSALSYSKRPGDSGPSSASDEVVECAKQLYLMNPAFDEAAARSAAEDAFDLKTTLKNDWYKLSTEHSISILARAILDSSDLISRVLPVRIEYPYDRKLPLRLKLKAAVVVLQSLCKMRVTLDESLNHHHEPKYTCEKQFLQF